LKSFNHTSNPAELRRAALLCLQERDAIRKVERVQSLAQSWRSASMELDAHSAPAAATGIPGVPSRPELVSPLAVRRRAMNTVEGRAILIHALAHIEFNAINLALDAIWRFSGLPRDYYRDWLQVAGEEALHFSLLNDHLAKLGYAYGDFPAHNSLWEMAEKTKHDVLARIALVPRTMEARGLDATPQIRAKLVQSGDIAAASILDLILRDEIGHVATGNRWFSWLCAARALDPVATHACLAAEYGAPVMRGPFNLKARRAAGFSDLELERLCPQKA
jgi:uncharacterized ferritin-like protein (DUF455 family)